VFFLCFSSRFEAEQIKQFSTKSVVSGYNLYLVGNLGSQQFKVLFKIFEKKQKNITE